MESQEKAREAGKVAKPASTLQAKSELTDVQVKRVGAQTEKVSTKAAAKKATGPISTEQRRQLISEAAYFRALSRGFAGGDPVADWLEAEREVDQSLAK